MSDSGMEARALLVRLFEAAVAAAMPGPAILANLPVPPRGRTIVVGAGKASAVMATEFERAWTAAGNTIADGLVVTKHGSALSCNKIRVVEASHPVPDDSSFRYAREMLELARSAGPDDLVVALMSGGGSSLLSLPPEAIGEAGKREVNRQLLACGATIHEMNVVRKHLSLIKGGRLAAAAHPARVETFVMSDIPGDDVTLVASGPTLASHSSRADALDVVRQNRLALPANVIDYLSSDVADGPAPGDAFDRDRVVVLATARQSLEEAAKVAASAGWQPIVLSDRIEGEARDVGRMHGALVRETIERGLFQRPCILLSGGETTVTVRTSQGRGGRNAEFLLGLSEAIDGFEGVVALAADTDGVDGSETNAGAFCDGQTAERLRHLGKPVGSYLASNDAYSAFEALTELLVVGPTGTNVNDFRAIVIA